MKDLEIARLVRELDKARAAQAISDRACSEACRERDAALLAVRELLWTTAHEEPLPGWLDARERAVAAMLGRAVPVRTVSLSESMAKDAFPTYRGKEPQRD